MQFAPGPEAPRGLYFRVAEARPMQRPGRVMGVEGFVTVRLRATGSATIPAPKGGTLMGRRSGYDIQDALRAGCDLFKERGYARTSIQDLVDCTGMNRLAIYEKFGGKEEFFYAAIDYYREVLIGEELLGDLLTGTPGLEDLVALLVTMRSINASAPGPGCLIVNANIELDGSDTRVAAAADAILELFRDAIRRALEGAAARGEIPDRGANDRRLEHVVTVLYSFMTLGYVSRDVADRLIGDLIEEVEAWHLKVATPVPL